MIILAWFALSLIVSYLGESRKIGVVWAFILSLVFSPVIGFLVVIASPVKPEKTT